MDKLIKQTDVINEIEDAFSMGEAYCDKPLLIGRISVLPSISNKGKMKNFEDILNDLSKELATNPEKLIQDAVLEYYSDEIKTIAVKEYLGSKLEEKQYRITNL